MKHEERKILLENLGWVVFRRNARARRLIIRIKKDGEIYVTIPYSVTFKRAVSFVDMKKEWIHKVRSRLKEEIKEQEYFDERTEFYTAKHRLIISRHQGERILKSRDDKYLSIRVPSAANIYDHEVQTKIKSIIIDTWRNEAREILVKRAYELASRHNFSLSGVRIKNMKTRWGSCSKQNTINLNLHLLRLPEHLQDYIILHELVHTVHKNHKKAFWDKLDDLTGSGKRLSKELKGFRLDF